MTGHDGEVVYIASCRTHCSLARRYAKQASSERADHKRPNILVKATAALLKPRVAYVWVVASDIDIALFACNKGTVGWKEAYNEDTQTGVVVCSGRNNRIEFACRAPVNYIEQFSEVSPRHAHLVERDNPTANVLTVVILPHYSSRSGKSEVLAEPIVNGHVRSSIFVHHALLASTLSACAKPSIVRIRADSAHPRAMPPGERVLVIHPTACHDIKGEIHRMFPGTTLGTPVAIYYDRRSRGDANAIAALLWKEGMQRWILCQCDIEPPSGVSCAVS